MVKTLTALTAAGVIAATAVSIPNKAEAYPIWVIPAIVGGVVGGAALGAAAANADTYPDADYGPAYSPRGEVYVQPRVAATTCHIVRERTANGWRRVEVCD
jgi:hypothetical protein